ncbi:Alkali-sensitive linkage protein 1 [Colletotrichum sp. SAR 10_86]|uniref:Alkali-sensitive linkage protein 1 n=1 Tax=Colletotrichum siamense TaxID=690259 RepID=UPI001872F0B1|nr:Alkali-sensitive linkage protein 1 [Colletotrichum siamense]KAI8199046.1 Alkali-sensitive linkage protein 1 [Colletotrichum sp. SAR 10_76]KAI8216123.1 Alkali-sensitive linkage protein 1 [Colletotrichum sp. SAR 10_77]KAI8218397.1 Alkali-sensitive linkage protein 1 [Colletotrichum sp. SAR 10_86]KAI8240792.1 Alkali-sensitive linkage protein 1 [Colletotrichum sp. SAR 10_96]KAI8271118.1 Alkali-sensitive linkage protein 1 [Colletotrichum sp. SAR 10_98]KAJ4995060.1 Alkali-sensitive linkage protei
MLSTFLLALLPLVAAQTKSSKRGLVFTPNASWPQDNQVWVQAGSDLTWYYNYQEIPSPAFSSKTQAEFEFVPMMWGVSSNPEDTTFLKAVKSLIEDKNINITHVLGFNEPDGPAQYGGSDIAPAIAAKAWVANFVPLGEMGVKLGLPACTGQPAGLPWLKQFLGNCSDLISTSGDKKNCTYDFLPVHWYDNFAGLASHIGERRANFPDAKIWVTEYAYAHQDLATTQEYYNQTADYFDKIDYIERYTYFGAFRSKTSNVGANASFLNNDGKLTDIGSWYLGFTATGVNPQSGNSGSTRQGPPMLVAAAATFAAVAFAFSF